MVLAELAGGVADRLEYPSQSRVLFLKAERRAWQTDGAKPVADRILTGDERCASRRAGGLRICRHQQTNRQPRSCRCSASSRLSCRGDRR